MAAECGNSNSNTWLICRITYLRIHHFAMIQNTTESGPSSSSLSLKSLWHHWRAYSRIRYINVCFHASSIAVAFILCLIHRDAIHSLFLIRKWFMNAISCQSSNKIDPYLAWCVCARVCVLCAVCVCWFRKSSIKFFFPYLNKRIFLLILILRFENTNSCVLIAFSHIKIPKIHVASFQRKSKKKKCKVEVCIIFLVHFYRKSYRSHSSLDVYKRNARSY